MIDWLNPSEDILEAKRIGYEEAMSQLEERERQIEAEAAHVVTVERDSQAMQLLRDGTVVELCEDALLDNDGTRFRAMTLDCRKAWAADPADAVIAASTAPEYDGP